uniref:Olfactory receptor n=1 Tax=Oncorhynchus kisutch TaxID=8019 RepID=A0A8C7KF32_ONCKI
MSSLHFGFRIHVINVLFWNLIVKLHECRIQRIILFELCYQENEKLSILVSILYMWGNLLLNQQVKEVFRLAAYGDIGQLKYFYFAVVTVLYFVIILANTLLIGVICIERSLHEPMYMFLCALFVNQLYGSTGLFPALMFYLLSDTHDISLLYCYLQIYVLYTCALTEFSNLAVMSYDRYISICYPLQYNNIMTPKTICGLILLSCLSSFSLMAIIISLSLRLQFCGNVLDRLYCDNYSIVKLACSNTMLNNIWEFYRYVLKSSKETKQKAFNTCTPHIASMLNFLFGWLFVILQGRYETADLSPILRTILFVYFLICPPIFNPLMYGVRMVKIRHACNKVLGLNPET